MATITKRTLNHQTAAVLESVATTGRPVTVTERGVPKWQIVALTTGGDDPYTAALREGRLTPRAERPRAWPPRRATGRSTAEIDRIIAQLKGDH
ncbi:MAG: type II toxin-antitoxin system prevent-host-death family antitoxin [Bifidobacteriaceae bacterium]|jgi:prevent-host-death family protein|nr:type II toxin-antitoxin system prevent-host-death family antitoxin [Bifidobacteriaceae bacterium]